MIGETGSFWCFSVVFFLIFSNGVDDSSISYSPVSFHSGVSERRHPVGPHISDAAVLRLLDQGSVNSPTI